MSAGTRGTSTPKSVLGWVVAGVLATVVAALAFIYFHDRGPEAAIVRSIVLPKEIRFRLDVQPSPDGRRLVFGARTEGDTYRLWLRSLDSALARPLVGSESASFSYPFWSPDGRFIGFGANGKLKKIDLTGGLPENIAAAPDFYGASWSPRGVIVFAPNNTGPLLRVAANGGAVTPATALNRARGETWHRYPWFLPDGRHFLYVSGSGANNTTIRIGSLDSAEDRIVGQTDSKAVYVSGFLLCEFSASVCNGGGSD